MTNSRSRRKVEGPTGLKRQVVGYALRRTAREFQRDECFDLAAALTYYGVLSVFPALLVMVSLLGLVGQTERTTDTVLGILDRIVPQSVVNTLRTPIEQLAASSSAGLALLIGLAVALWSASRYIGAFGRAMNRIYGVEEGRSIWRRLPVRLLITIITLLLVTAEALMLVLSGPIAQAIGRTVGLGDAALTVWSYAKWPVVLLFAMVMIAILYTATPNIRSVRVRWVSVGAFVAVLTWVGASLAFALYVANFGRFNETYGALAGVIVFLLWMWVTNLALLLGAELDAELERARQLQAGLPAEHHLQLALRDEADDSGYRNQVMEAVRIRERA
ncbi:YihY/virulence factor BrkB family protein [Mycobacterium sp. IDR2000157661]|uniref:YihY/virulence factor BrkB family protein n=1 Tax=Mycobacterium sp. IDR2000157661 TaxID=2867005 RepID=UPI001EECBFC1|nr:YihY/virulence factor BrkB family protein [Mycobacterium sp. IDR2000157661]